MTVFEGSDAEDANSKLAQGLKSCRAVVKNYRSLLETDLSIDAAASRSIEQVNENLTEVEGRSLDDN